MSVVPVTLSYDVLISSGEPDPAVAQRSQFQTLFIENAADDLSAQIFEFRAHPIVDAPLPGAEELDRELWPTCLFASSWSATWLAPQRTEGLVTLRGSVHADYGPLTTEIGGVAQRLFEILPRRSQYEAVSYREVSRVRRYPPGYLQSPPSAADSTGLLVLLEVD